MDEMVLRIFQSEVERQCEFALSSAVNINDSLQNLGNENANTQLWFFVQSFLISSANVSKLLWGSNKSIAESRKPLRDSLNITENTFEEIRNLRNHFEHIDERIEKWASSSERRSFVDSNIGPTNMIVGVDPDDFLRNFDTTKGAVTFKGEDYLLQPIIDELVKIHECARQEVSKSH